MGTLGQPQNAMKTDTRWSRLGLVLSTVFNDIRAGFLDISRHSLALLGLAVVVVVLAVSARADLQAKIGTGLMAWLEKRQLQLILAQDHGSEQTPASRTVAAMAKDLSSEQLAVTQWLSRRYKVAPEPLGALVHEAWTLGERSQISPSLILSIVAVESRFNPFAASSIGTLGLMQIAPETHDDALAVLGGRMAAFDPLTNLRVGTRLLQSMVQQSGSIEEALNLYASTSGKGDPNRYVRRVLAEQQHLDIIGQKAASANSPLVRSDPVATQAHGL